MRFLALLAVALIATVVGTAVAAEKPYRHCYYLFAMRPEPGENEYIPLVISREDLAAGAPLKAALVMTYERDSIWEISRNPVEVKSPDPRSVAARHVEMRGQRYRYQEIPREEALKLLKSPEGKLPISRLHAPVTPSVEPLRDELVRDLQAAN